MASCDILIVGRLLVVLRHPTDDDGKGALDELGAAAIAAADESKLAESLPRHRKRLRTLPFGPAVREEPVYRKDSSQLFRRLCSLVPITLR